MSMLVFTSVSAIAALGTATMMGGVNHMKTPSLVALRPIRAGKPSMQHGGNGYGPMGGNQYGMGDDGYGSMGSDGYGPTGSDGPMGGDPAFYFWTRVPFHFDQMRSAEHRSALRDGRRRNVHQAPPPASIMKGLESAWVLIFHPGERNEGVYTLHDSVKDNISVLAFECSEDADRFAQGLRTQGFDLATPLLWDTNRLTAFCGERDYEMSVVPRGEVPMPPAHNDYHPGAKDGGDPDLPYRENARHDPYVGYRQRLEAIFPQKPDNCGDDDCNMPSEEEEEEKKGGTVAALRPEDLSSSVPLRSEAVAAIDDVLKNYGDEIDLETLAKRLCEKIAADKQASEQPNKQADGEEDEDKSKGGEGSGSK
jgi:hypothetical protein